LSDIFSSIDELDLYSADGLDKGDGEQLNSSNSDISTATNDTDANSDSGRRRRRRRKTDRSAASRGRGGNQQQLHRARSIDDITAAVRGEEQQLLNLLKALKKQ